MKPSYSPTSYVPWIVSSLPLTHVHQAQCVREAKISERLQVFVTGQSRKARDDQSADLGFELLPEGAHNVQWETPTGDYEKAFNFWQPQLCCEVQERQRYVHRRREVFYEQHRARLPDSWPDRHVRGPPVLAAPPLISVPAVDRRPQRSACLLRPLWRRSHAVLQLRPRQGRSG